jgi:hypothetical protein
MRRLTPGRTPSSRPGQLYAVEEPPSQKTPPLSRNKRRPCASSHSSKTNPSWPPYRKPIPETGTKKNEPTGRPIDNRATPREKGGLGSWSMWVAIEFISTARVRGAPLWSSWAQGSLSIGGSSNLKSQNLLRCVRMTIQESVGATKVRNLWGSGATTSQSKASDAWRLQTRSQTGRNNGLEPT